MARSTLALVLALSSFLAVAEEPLPKELPPDQEAAATRAAEVRGAAIFRHDKAAAVATDAAVKVRAFKKDKRVKGWITEERQGQIVVTFIDQTPAALYRGTVSSNGALIDKITVLESPAPLTEFESGAAAARAVALTSDFQPCSKDYNSVVLPADNASGNWVVYLIPGTTKNNVVPIGGTYRLETDGSRVLSQRGFTRTCIALPYDKRAVGMFITHLLDSVPTEAHVFWSLWAKQPMYIATPPNGTVWSINGDKIKLEERKAAEG